MSPPTFIVAMLAFFASITLMLSPTGLEAQGIPGCEETRRASSPNGVPIWRAIVFSGEITVAGEPLYEPGLQLTARIGDKWETCPVEPQPDGEGGSTYADLVVAVDPALDLEGSQIEFWLNGEVAAHTTDWYAVIFDGGFGVWTFPILRGVDLDFPSVTPVEPTPLQPYTGPLPPPLPMADISALRVGGFGMPATFALIAMLAGLAFVSLGLFAFKRWA